MFEDAGAVGKVLAAFVAVRIGKDGRIFSEDVIVICPPMTCNKCPASEIGRYLARSDASNNIFVRASDLCRGAGESVGDVLDEVASNKMRVSGCILDKGSLI